MGCVGGAIWHFIRGFYHSPSREKFKGALSAVKHRAPLLGGSFAMWGGMFSTVDCILLWYRQVDSPLNAVFAGFFTGGILAIRAGFKRSVTNAVAGGVILGIIEGVGVAQTYYVARQQLQMMHEMQKLQEEQMNRKMQGLPELTQEEIMAVLQGKEEKKQGFISGMFNKG